MGYIRNFIRIACLLVLDISAFYSAIILDKIFHNAFNLNFKIKLNFIFFDTLPLLVFLLPLMFYQQLYTKRFSFNDEVKRIVKVICLLIVVIIVIMLSQLFSFKAIPLLSLLELGFIFVFFLSLYRFIGKRILYHIGIGTENVIIIGAGSVGRLVLEGLQKEKNFGYNILGFLDNDPAKHGILIENKKVLGGTKELKEYLNKLSINSVIVAIPSLPIEELSELTNEVQKYAKKILLIPNLKGIALLNTELYHVFTKQLFLLQINNNLQSAFNRFTKWLFDMIVSIVFLPFIILAIIIIGILIKMDSPGPIFYRHTRVGQHGKKIDVIKFRSMYINSKEKLEEILKNDPEKRLEWETFYKLKDDPRITKIGKILRKTSLDELPQIFNVLKGDMSLVGPRPVLTDEIEKYYKEYAEYYFLVPPGITGLWQVSGRNDEDYDFRVNIDTWYVLNWSVWLDLTILFKTIKVVLKREGAY
ncbi:MAG TPA: undecaprenyl-phosphate galactose phosphotransferase WbaP [Syntrophorhabdaceae bacterium]|nr:undecaprenyl-phosphate galactose phosphotransferase WbaP [Syntrophorhabdaceae bacterium]